MTTKVSFEASIGPFFDRLDTFSIARLLKITLVLLFFGEIHYLPSLRASLGRELTQRRFSSAQIGPFLMQKKRSATQEPTEGPCWAPKRAGIETLVQAKFSPVLSCVLRVLHHE